MHDVAEHARGAQLFDDRRLCRGIGIDANVARAPTAARPTSDIAALASVASSLERIQRGADAGRQPARAHDRARLVPQLRLYGRSTASAPRRRRAAPWKPSRPSGLPRACSTCAFTTSGSDAKRTRTESLNACAASGADSARTSNATGSSWLAIIVRTSGGERFAIAHAESHRL